MRKAEQGVYRLGFVWFSVHQLDFCCFLQYVQALCGQCLWCASGSRFGPALPLWLMILMRQFVKIKTTIHSCYGPHCVFQLLYLTSSQNRVKCCTYCTFFIELGEKRKQIVSFIVQVKSGHSWLTTKLNWKF